MTRGVLLVYTASMLLVHLFSRWLVRDLLVSPGRFRSAKWLVRVEGCYYLLLLGFWTGHRAVFPAVWPLALMALLHLSAWLVGEYSTALSNEAQCSPRLTRSIDAIAVFDLVEVVFLIYVGWRLLIS